MKNVRYLLSLLSTGQDSQTKGQLDLIQVFVFYQETKRQCKIYHITWPVKKNKFLLKHLLAMYEIITDKRNCRDTLSFKKHLPRFHEHRLLYSTIVPLMN